MMAHTMTKVSEPVIGAWWAVCCIEDLYQIETEEDLADVLWAISDNDTGMTIRVWADRESALNELLMEAGTQPSPSTVRRLGLPTG